MSWNADHTNRPAASTNYYRNNVIGGPGAFVMVAGNFSSFGQAILNKLIAEIATVQGTIACRFAKERGRPARSSTA